MVRTARPARVRFFHIYGVPAGSDDIPAIHVERVSDRKALHGGQVTVHSHPHLHQLSLWHGGGAYELDGVHQPLGGHALTIVPPATPHGFVLEAQADAVVISISAAYCAALRSDDKVSWAQIDRPAQIDLSAETHAHFSMLFTAIAAECRTQRRYQGEAISALLRLLMIEMDRLGDFRHQVREKSPLDGFLALVDKHLHEHWPIERYVQALGTTVYRLNRAARDNLGRSAVELVRERLGAEAQRLLLFTKMGVAEAGYAMGFDDPAHFGRFFQRQYGQSPGAWRQDQIARATADAGSVSKRLDRKFVRTQ